VNQLGVEDVTDCLYSPRNSFIEINALTCAQFFAIIDEEIPQVQRYKKRDQRRLTVYIYQRTME
jgi:hypothetical protein